MPRSLYLSATAAILLSACEVHGACIDYPEDSSSGSPVDVCTESRGDRAIFDDPNQCWEFHKSATCDELGFEVSCDDSGYAWTATEADCDTLQAQ